MKNQLKSVWQFFFGDSARAFGSVSLILLVLLAISPAKNHFSSGAITRINTCTSSVDVPMLSLWSGTSRAEFSRSGFLSSK